MAGFKDFADGDPLEESDLDDYLMKQTVMKFTGSAARDAAVTSSFKREGMVVYRDDTNVLEVSRDATAGNYSTIGPVHGQLTSWTPTVTQSGSVSVTVSYARYIRTGRWIQGSALLSVTGSGTSSNTITIGSLPATGTTGCDVVGGGYIDDTSASARWPVIVSMPSTTTFRFHAVINNQSDVNMVMGSGANAMTDGLASGDTISFHFAYEAGSDA